MARGVKPGSPGVSERFDAKYVVDPTSLCWYWTGYLDRAGYGKFGTSYGRVVLAHRFAYERAFGPISPGLTLDHLCRNRSCVNPFHLEPVTRGENVRRGLAGRYPRPFLCVNGHPRTAENVYRDRRGCGACRTCHREREAVRRAARRAA